MHFSRVLGSKTFLRGERGLYHGVRTRFGNKVSHSQRKTRRAWRPNAQTATLWSDILERRVRIRVSTTALRRIHAAGGLDRYILDTPKAHLQSEFALALRTELQRLLEARKAAGAPATWIESVPSFAAADTIEASERS